MSADLVSIKLPRDLVKQLKIEAAVAGVPMYTLILTKLNNAKRKSSTKR